MKRRPRRRPSPEQEPLLESLRLHTRHLLALGGLLEACGACPRSEPLDSAVAADTGRLVLQEAGELLRLLSLAERASLHA